MLGVDNGKLQMQEYDPDWAVKGNEIAAKVRNAMKDVAVCVNHVGSTAIPGMLAKPIIDIAVAVKDLSLVESCVESMKEAGFDYAGEVIPGQREFSVNNGQNQRVCHVHVCLIDSRQWEDYNLIVEYCITHEEERNAYINLKKELLTKYHNDPEKYGPAKHDFVESMLIRAKAWKESQK